MAQIIDFTKALRAQHAVKRAPRQRKAAGTAQPRLTAAQRARLDAVRLAAHSAL